jgi:hypothetical protein
MDYLDAICRIGYRQEGNALTHTQAVLDQPYLGLDDLDINDIHAKFGPESEDPEYDEESMENEEDELDILNDADDEPDDEDIPQVDATESRR